MLLLTKLIKFHLLFACCFLFPSMSVLIQVHTKCCPYFATHFLLSFLFNPHLPIFSFLARKSKHSFVNHFLLRFSSPLFLFFYTSTTILFPPSPTFFNCCLPPAPIFQLRFSRPSLSHFSIQLPICWPKPKPIIRCRSGGGCTCFISQVLIVFILIFSSFFTCLCQ